MTPSERERRLEAAWRANWQAGPSFTGAGDKHAMRAALDAADEAVPVVPATWDGLLEHLDAMYPADVFSGESGDVGARLVVVLARQVAGLERELSELRERHTKLARGVWGHPDDWQRPSFSGEEGTEG